MADIYPPGPGGAFPDTLDVTNIQNPAAVPHPVNPDSVLGIGGIITGFDTFPSGFAMYIQISNGGPWTGIDVFTGGDNFASQGFSQGDSVVVYGSVAEFGGGTEIVAFDGAFGTDRVIRQVSTGNPLPPFHDGTYSELNYLPTNPQAEQWEGCLVRLQQEGRVVRTNFTGGSGPFRWMRVVDNTICPDGSIGPCDTVLVDMSTLANPAINPPAVGTLVNNVQGIYEQRSTYNVQIRDGNDLELLTPPGLASAYIIDDNKIKVVFDRDVTQASAENAANYSLASFSAINSATQTSGSTVELDYTDILPPVNLETLTVNGIVSVASGLPMTTPEQASFWNKVNTIATIQAPDPAFLSAVPPCEDRSRFAGPGASTGALVTWRCVGSTGNLDGLWYMQDEAGGLRSGLSVFAPSSNINRGQKYLVVGRIQEFFGETEAIQTVEIINEGAGTVPDPITREDPSNLLRVGTVIDTTCDHAQNTLTGEDYEGTIVTLHDIKAYEGSPFPGAFFNAAGGPYPDLGDTINVDNDGTHSFQADSGQFMDVTGVIRFSFGAFVITPRDDADIFPHAPNVAVGGPNAPSLAFYIYPNPARTQTLSFALPHDGDLRLEAYDLAGRRVATLASGRYTAGTHNIKWDGRDANGSVLGAGVYFYRLKFGGETLTARGVRID